MQPITRKATVIVRMWTDEDTVDNNNWRGRAEFIGSGQSHQFQSLDEFIIWLRQQLLNAEEKPE